MKLTNQTTWFAQLEGGDDQPMVKKFKGPVMLLLLLLTFVLAALPSRAALAAGTFGIPSYESEWVILPNGDVQVTENVTYDIRGEINGIFHEVDTRLGSDIANTPANRVGIDFISVAVVENGTERPLYMTDQGAGREGLFEFYEVDDELQQFKVFEPSSNERKLFRFRYTLTNAVTKFNDIATLNWIMIGSGWDVPLENVRITIRIPDGAAKEDLRIFSHGDLTGFNEILDNRTFNVQIALMEPGSSIENLVIFPLELVPGSAKIVARTELPTILEREARFAEQANREREEAQRRVEEYLRQLEAERARREAGRRLNPILLILGALGLGGTALVVGKFGREVKPSFVGDYYRELPGDYTPAVMSYLLDNGRIESKDIMATLMDLARKDILAIEPYTTEKRSLFGSNTETDYRLVTRDPSPAQLQRLSDHEQFLYDWFINDLGDGRTLAMDELEGMMKTTANAYQFNRDYDSFKGYIASMGEAQGFREANKTSGSGIFYLIGAGLIAFGAYMFLAYQNLLGIVPALAGVILIGTTSAMVFKRKLTPYGSDQTAMWKAFKRFLLTFSNMDKAEIPALTIWNHYLVYATALGVAKEVIEQLPKVYTMAEMQDPRFTRTFYPDFYTGRGFMMMDRSLNQAVSTATQTIQKAQQVAASRRSSSSGGGGGFSGGFSGGGGGRGGGGTF